MSSVQRRRHHRSDKVRDHLFSDNKAVVVGMEELFTSGSDSIFVLHIEGLTRRKMQRKAHFHCRAAGDDPVLLPSGREGGGKGR